jgi:ATP phosphoribosyltransferase
MGSLNQQGNEGFEIFDNAVMGYLKDGGMDIGIDGYDSLCPPHARDMLERSGDSAGDIKLRGDGLTGGSDLLLAFKPSQVARRARGSHS